MKRTITLIEKNENMKYISFAKDLPNLNFLACRRFLREMAVCFESPIFIAPLIRLLKMQEETSENKSIVLDIIKNLMCGNEKILIAINSPACDSYMTLLKMLMKNPNLVKAKANPSTQTASIRAAIALQEKAIDLFRFIFELRKPTIIRDLSCIGASSTLLREQEL